MDHNAAATAPVRRRDPATVSLAAGVGLLATLVGLLLLAWLILFITKGRFLKPTFERYVSRSAQRDVRVAGDFQLYLDPLDVKFVAEGLTVSNPAWASQKNFFESRRINTRLATIPLIFGKRRVHFVDLVDGHVDAEWDARHVRNTWTFGDPDAKGEPFQMPVIERATVSGSTVRYRDPQMVLRADLKIETVQARANGRGATIDNAINFAGTGSLRGEVFRLYGAQHSPNALVAGGRNRFELHARSRPTQIDVAGTLPGATVLEGSDLNVAARGGNIRNLFDLLGVAAPDTRSYRVRSKLTKVGEEWRFTRIVGKYGNSDLNGSMTVSLPNGRVLLVADLNSRLVDMIDIGPFFGYDPQALATRGVTAAVPQTGAAPRMLPDAPLRIESISAFDARVKYRIKDIRQPYVPISNVDLTLDLDHKLLKLSPLTFDIAGGKLASDISINARVPAVVTEYDIRLSPTPLATLFARFGVSKSGTDGSVKARINMKGTGDTVRESLASSNGRIAVVLPRGTFWTQYIQLSEFDVGTFVQKMFQKKLKEPVQVNCGLIGFTVRNGVAAADPILIDTTKNVMSARGGFSFKDESLDLAFRADAKKFSLFSGQSPVGINGHFAAPGYQIVTPELMARGGAGVALGLVASPVAAVLAFVDPGDAKSAACGPILSGARASAQRTVKGDGRKDVGTQSENREKAKGGDGKKEKKFLGIF
ncbi:MAG: AsmA family protein [Sphingomonas sp.]